jgi:hypothetical protein
VAATSGFGATLAAAIVTSAVAPATTKASLEPPMACVSQVLLNRLVNGAREVSIEPIKRKGSSSLDALLRVLADRP